MSKKKSSQNLNLFESNAPPTPAERQEAAIEAFVLRVDPTACPNCGGKSLASSRPAEMGGTRYCPICQGEDGCFYFTPSGGA